jgi:hypothetical protein
MRGKIARELRKAAEFKVHDKRDYHSFNITNKVGQIFQIDPDNGVKIVEKVVPRYLTECVTPERKIYQHLKKFYSGFAEEEAQFTTLPSEEDINEQFRKIKQEVRDTTGTRLPNENDGDSGASDESRE